jgi:SAM-dependent methyltransferase
MALKHLVPMRARNLFRPAYQQACQGMLRARQSLVDTGLWPKSPEWRRVRSELAGVQAPVDLYPYAQREFGILQIADEIVPFLEYVARIQPKVVGEIGVKFGGNTFLFERALPDLQRLVGIDLHLQNVGKARYLAPDGLRLRFLEGSSYSQPMIDRVRKWLNHDRFDFLFIDGDHTYDGVVNDFISYYDMVRPGGLIALHDIAPDEFGRFGRRSPECTSYGGEVYLLWRRLRERFPHQEFVQSWDQYGYGIGVITKHDDQPLPADWTASLLRREIAEQLPVRS